ncbi:NAD-dependent epimerase/dehydratase family protein [Microbulbifer hydrolyticus]|uniref:NAD-dependent epimerase/dehydratase family protein n=1 Tax=Microbulbifer hydrolyticus TaxID=48074 RepID=A0A6P1T7J3_9GAMM|nr:NAD-dependent epimerase/dehydratase family protein [Microbulbifer hydrolyticus]MBB5211601.1 nucleoside-diphosphate-sugar epimerase [Microbulbifer hydrolyticus]QHQ37663.1 NAD-dependent epimerase/dehydratase family protein [Microbulbifer hydrolyticus]
MHAFVTGGTGFLGANLIEQLIAGGWQVTAMHRPGANVRRLQALGATPVEAALDDVAALENALLAEVDAIFHLAASTNMWRGGNAQQWRDNVQGSANIARVARHQFASQKRAGRLIVTSSISAYGYHDNPITEASPKLADDPRHHYLYTKKRAELAVQEEITKGLDAVFLNPCGIVGKYDVSSWAQTFFMIAEDRLPGVPPGAGSFCHAGAVARAHINAFYKGRCGENYILAGTDATFLEFFGIIAKLLGKPVPRRTTPAVLIRALARVHDLVSQVTGREPVLTPEKAAMITRRVVADSRRAATELGYANSLSLEEMLQESRDWLVAEGLLTVAPGTKPLHAKTSG